MFEELKAEATRVLEAELSTRHTVHFAVPKEGKHGDATTTVALEIARKTGRKPREIAEFLSAKLAASALVERAEVRDPGYVNVWLNASALLRELNRTREASVARATRQDEAPVIVEGSDPNIAKPLGVHHILATIIGQCLANFYRHFGYNVIHWNYIGDWGTQFGHLAVAVKKWGTKQETSAYSLDELLALYVRVHQEAEDNPSLKEAGRETFRKLEQGDPELHAFWSEVVSITKRSLAVMYERLHVSFDCELGESFYNDKMDAVIAEGVQKGVFREGEGGALIVEFPPETGLPVYMIRRSDGATLYSTRDLAQMRYRIDTYHPLAIIIPTDVSQTLYFQQLITTCRMLQWELPKFEHAVFGRMRFKDAKMSTRKGTVLKLEEVLDEAVTEADRIIAEHEEIQTGDQKALSEMMGVGALVYGILSQNRKQDIVFDWAKMLSFEGNSAPYLQYTHARARSVLRKAEIEGECAFPEKLSAELTDKERILLRTLLQFSSALEDALLTHMPHKVANYLYGLCQDYNAFYNTEPILKAQEPTRSLRLALTACTASFLKTGAALLTLRVPDRM